MVKVLIAKDIKLQFYACFYKETIKSSKVEKDSINITVCLVEKDSSAGIFQRL